MTRLQLVQELRNALFAHPQAGPVPIPASLITLVVEELHKPPPESPAKEQPMMDKLVERFLNWPLPDSVCSDDCVTQRDWGKAQGWPKRVGTNLLTADEARQMLEYVLSPEPTKEQPGEQNASSTEKGGANAQTNSGTDAVAGVASAQTRNLAPDVAAMVKRLREMHRRYTDSIYAEAAAMIEKLGQGWIPVSERLPERDVDVLIHWQEIKETRIGYHVPGVDVWFWWKGDATVKADAPATHWMPLPPPPERP